MLLIVGTVALALCAPGLRAEPPPALSQAKPIPPEHVPLYSVVHQYFALMAHFQESDPALYESRLRDVGIDPRSEAGRAFGYSIERARSVLSKPTVDLELKDSEEMFLAFQEAAIGEKVNELAEVYAGLLGDLDASGFESDRLRTYIEEVIRPSVSIWVEVTPGQDPLSEFLADRNAQQEVPFEQVTEAAYLRGATNLVDMGKE